MEYAVRELEMGEILDQAIKLVKNHFALLFKIVAVLYIPTLLVQTLVAAYVARVAAVNVPPGQAPNLAAAGPVLVVTMSFLVFLIIGILPLTNAAIIHAVSRNYLGESSTLGQAYGKALSRLPALIGTALLQWIFVTLGLICFVIPGIYLMYTYYFATQVVIIDGLSGTKALRRSGKLVKGQFSTVVVLGFIVGLLAWLIALAAGFVPTIYLRALMTACINGVVLAFSGAVHVVFYFSSRCKHEQFDLTILAEGVARDVAPVAEPS